METTKKYLEQFANWEREAGERAYAGTLDKLIQAGLAQQGQKEIAPAKIRAAFKAAYLPELLAQESKASTGGAGKFADVANRALMNEARERPMSIADLHCRTSSQKDIFVSLDTSDTKTAQLGKSRAAVEVKTGAGVLAQGVDEADSWRILAEAVRDDKLIVWYPLGVPDWQDGELDAVDDMPYFFGTYSQLFGMLEGYGKGLQTWLKVCGTAVNFQNVTSSGKKVAFLEEATETAGYDWPMFRDWGRLRDK